MFACTQCAMITTTDDLTVVGRNCSASDFAEAHRMEKLSADVLAGFYAGRKAYGDGYADYLIRHAGELLAKGYVPRAWPECLIGNDGE